MRFGITILPEFRWADAEPKWRAAEQMGFDHAWTYDHLTWSGLPDSPWHAAIPTLTAAALATSTIRIGTLVASPNFRHPGAFAREVVTLDDISAGRLDLAIGTGGDLDSRKLNGPQLSVRQRVDRFEEFVGVLDRALREDHLSVDGDYFGVSDLRTLPGCVQRPRVPFIVAANGPRSLRLAARFGQGWVTTGLKGDNQQEWWRSVADLSVRFDDLGVDLPRYLSVDAGHVFSLSSVSAFEELVGRADEAGFTELITHWPRPQTPYAGDEATLERVIADVIPRWRTGSPH